MMTNIQIHQTINNKDRQPDMNSLQSGKLTKSDRPTHSKKKTKKLRQPEKHNKLASSGLPDDIFQSLGECYTA